MKNVRFYGVERSVVKWRDLVRETVGIECGDVKVEKVNYDERHYFDVTLTDEDIALLQEKLWYAESGTGTNATGRPYKWNDCMGFEVVR